jgi:hypothetical protein
MKKYTFQIILIFLLTAVTSNAQVGIGTTSPNASAVLDVTSTSKGFLPPRMTQAQRNTIATPAAGLIVWCTDCGTAGELQVNNGTVWTNMTGGTASATVPGAPTSLVATAGNTQASVTFTPPASNGGSTITGYTVTSSPGGFTTTGVSSPLVVTGLTNGTTYSFIVTATNSVGTSAASSASNSVIPLTVPSPPAITSVTPGDGHVVVAFTAPVDNGGATITTYTATSSPGSITGTVSQAGGGTITVNGLTNGTTYTFTVTATNSVGTSAASSASSSVTPVAASITYTILDQYTNRVPTGTSYVNLQYYSQYIDAGSIDASPFVITKQTAYSGGILFYGSTELISESNENTFRLTATSGNFDFISFNLDDLEQNIGGQESASTIPIITLTSSSGSTISFQSTVDYNADFDFYMYMFMDSGVKTLNWNNVEWVDIKTKYAKAKTKNYVLKAL